MVKEIIFYAFFLLLLIGASAFSQETNNDIEDEYIYLWDTEGITIFGEFSSDSIEAEVLTILNGSLSNRKQFIESNLLEDAGFRRTANVRYRKSDTSEKTSSVFHGIAHALSFGIVPMKPFFEIDYDRLPRGEYYSFESVIISSELKIISADVLSVLELEYMLQIEFCNGTLFEYNRNYYTEKNINKFELMILRLPNSPESIRQSKERYLNIELPKIKNTLERYNNPSENYLRAIQNLGDLIRSRN